MSNRNQITIVVVSIATIICHAATPTRVDAVEPIKLTAEQSEFFESKIRPIFADHCYECHSSESGVHLEGSLLLDSRWGWATGGDSGPAILPGNVDESLVIQAVRYQDDGVSPMPPRSKLSEQQIKHLEQWIRTGAPDPREKPKTNSAEMVESFDLKKRFVEHSSWRPISDPQPPAVSNESWANNTIDRFVLSKLDAVGLKPAIPAEKTIWIRRVYFDLIGLPPTVEQIDAFLADDTESAKETVVDQLLKSDHFGEKWARHWMDLVRYAETYGHEFDYPLNHAYQYRDYLIRAFNNDIPYDQFLREHVAGDLITTPRRHPTEMFNESVIGTGFWYFHEATHAPTDVLQNEADIVDNQLDVFGKTFLGLTIACARCHDHKFDAIATADYYALSAYIQSSCRQLYPLDPGNRIGDAVKKLSELGDQYSAQAAAFDTDNRSNDPAAYFAAATSLIRSATNAPVPTGNDAIVWEDFEQGYENWKRTGTAFGETPQTDPLGPQKSVDGKVGKAFASSFSGSSSNTPVEGKDQWKGSLTSNPFTIERPYINLLVGGGKSGVSTDLLIDGEAVRSAVGENSETLVDRSWDVGEFLGKQAVIRISDTNTGGWGHINVDQIVFASVPTVSLSPLRRPSSETVKQKATADEIDADRLQRWVNRLITSTPNSNSSDPMEMLAHHVLNAGNIESTKKAFQQRRSHQQDAVERFASSNEKLADFGAGGLPPGWTVSGDAFRAVNHDHHYIPIEMHSKPGTVDSGVFGKRATGILRSPTFKITKPRIHMLIRATSNARVRVIVDNYEMAQYNALLFRGMDLAGNATDTQGQWKWKSLAGNLDKYIGHNAYLEFSDRGDETIAIDQIWQSDVSPPPVIDPLLQHFASGIDGLSNAWAHTLTDRKAGRRSEFAEWLVTQDLVSAGDGCEAIIERAKQIAAKLPHSVPAIAMAEGTQENAHVYVRGNPHQLGQEVPPRNLEALGGETGNRLQLANRMASLENPLTSRVIVNRFWHHLFGRGIVPTVDDFGPQGQPASHPELLDHLATNFVRNGWSMKKTIRQIVLSETYGQASVAHDDNESQEIETRDPTNSLLHRMPVRRLPAESIRDAILAVSGRLDPRLYGPSIPTHRTEFMTGRGARGSGPLDGAGRRSVYLSIYRNFLNPFMLAFDMPNPFGPKGRRSNSNVPAQALTLMNDPFVLEQSRHWAGQIANASTDKLQRIRQMVRRAHSVTPTDAQIKRLAAFIDANDGQDQHAWAELGHALFNMKSFYFLR